MSRSWGVNPGVVVSVSVYKFLMGHGNFCREGVSECIEFHLFFIVLVVFLVVFLNKGQVVSSSAVSSSSSVSVSAIPSVSIAVSSSTIPSVSHGRGELWRAEGKPEGSSGT